MTMLSRALLLLCALAALAFAGCGGDDDEEATSDAKSIQPSQAEGAKGDVTLCIGKDTTGIYKSTIRRFNQAGTGVRAKIVELPESADEQRTQLVQRQRAKSDECDVLGLDVIWTAEFAAQGWLSDVTPVIDARKDEFIATPLETTKFEDKYWGVPYKSNAGFLYFRTDQADAAPTTWEDTYEQAEQNDGLVYQGARYEGLVVNFLELYYSAGGKVLSDDGKTAEVGNDTAKEVLRFMAEGVESGAVPKAVTTYQEEEARRAFEAGNASFMRNWPYAYALGNESEIEGKFDIATFPSYGGSEGAGVLGGYNMGISAFSKNPGGSLAFINFLTTPESQLALAETAEPPVIRSVYDDPAIKEAFPFADKMLQAIEQAQPRPVSPVYPQISEAISENVHAALSGDMEPDAAVDKMNEDIQKALETF
jgi:multiple sugar transport system substrate-binding protein